MDNKNENFRHASADNILRDLYRTNLNLELEYFNKLNDILKVFTELENKERAHIQADDILCELLNKLGFYLVVDKYNEIPKWYT